MKTWTTAKDIDDRLRALKNLRAPAYRVVCLYLPDESCERCDGVTGPARELEKPSVKRLASQRRAA